MEHKRKNQNPVALCDILEATISDLINLQTEVNGMNEKAKQARNAYKREWNRKNRDKVKKHQEAYWEKKAREAEAEKGEAIAEG